jgi:predicted dehydrogenase
MNKYTVEIIGCGNKGATADAPGSGNAHKHLSYAHACMDNPGFEIVNFYDIDQGQRGKAYETWGVIYKPHTPDVYIIATPDNAHYEYLLRIASMPEESRPRLVVCEKPLCEEVSEAERVVGLYKQYGIPLLVDYTRRFIPYWQDMRRRRDQAGEFIRGYCVYNRGALHTLSHFVDTALWFNGNMDNIDVTEIAPDYQWVYQWGLFYECDFFSEMSANRAHGEVPNPIYDNHTKHVMENAYNFLEGKEHLRCTGMDALLALKATYAIMERGKG